MHMARCALGIEFDIEHLLGNDTALSRTRQAGILDGVFEIEHHPRLGTVIAFVHQHGAALQQITVALQGEVDDRVEQRMTRADKGGQRLALRCDQRSSRRRCAHSAAARFADADQAVAIAHRRRDMGDLVARGSRCLAVPPRRLKASRKNDSM